MIVGGIEIFTSFMVGRKVSQELILGEPYLTRALAAMKRWPLGRVDMKIKSMKGTH